MHRRAIVRRRGQLVLACLVACARANPRAPAAVPVVGATVRVDTIYRALPDTLPAPVTDLSGAWMKGTGEEPSVAVVRLQVACTYHPPAWVIQQQGSRLEVWDFPASTDQGVASPVPLVARAGSRGSIYGAQVLIQDGENWYDLRYDEHTGHLRGTSNGQPFWAVRQEVMRPDPCPAVP